MSNLTESLTEISLDQLATAHGGQNADAAMSAIKSTGQLIGCAREAYDQGLRHGNQGFTPNGGVFTQVGKGLSATQRAGYGIDACLKGATDTANAQNQLDQLLK